MSVFLNMLGALSNQNVLCVDPGTTQFRVAMLNAERIETDTFPPYALWRCASTQASGQAASTSQRPPNFADGSASAALAHLGGGKIFDYHRAEAYIKSILGSKLAFWRGRPQGVIAIAAASNPVEKRAMQELFESVGLRNVFLIEAPIAAAIGAGLDINSGKPIFIGVLGAQLCEFSILQGGRVYDLSAVHVGWYDVLRAVGFAVRQRYGAWPDQQRLDVALQEIGFGGEIHPYAERAFKEALPSSPDKPSEELTTHDARAIMRTALSPLAYRIVDLWDRQEPHLANAVRMDGGTLAGGLALHKGLTEWLGEVTGLRLYLAQNPRECVVRGVKKSFLAMKNG